MTQLANETDLRFKGDGEPSLHFIRPVKGSTKIYKGGLVGGEEASGYARPLLGTTGLMPLGVALATIDNLLGADGDARVPIARGVLERPMGNAGDALTEADFGQPVYAIDDQTFGKTDGDGTRPYVGPLVGINADLGLAQVYVGFDRAIPLVRARSLSFAAGDFSAAATTQVILIGTPLPANVRVKYGELVPTTLLSGGGTNAAHVELGDYTGGVFTASLKASTDVFTGASQAAVGAIAASFAGASAFGGLQLAAKITTGGANVAALTAGLLKVHFLFDRAA